MINACFHANETFCSSWDISSSWHIHLGQYQVQEQGGISKPFLEQLWFANGYTSTTIEAFIKFHQSNTNQKQLFIKNLETKLKQSENANIADPDQIS